MKKQINQFEEHCTELLLCDIQKYQRDKIQGKSRKLLDNEKV